MDAQVIEARGETARQLNAIAKEQGLTTQELAMHILLDYLEEYYSSDESESDDREEEDEE
ncbi:MAG: hypothetical protein AB1793_01980 [Candidatus Thermoplasmatota archaeon]